MAYAAVVSLKHTMHRLLNPSESQTHLRQSFNEFDIHDDLSYLQSFLETIRSLPSGKSLDSSFETRVKDAATELQDLIDSHLSESGNSTDDQHTSFTLLLSQQLPQLRQEITSFAEALMTATIDDREHSFTSASIKVESTSEKRKMVGLKKQLDELEDWVLDGANALQITSVVGMAGIGKTTLVEEFYNHKLVMKKFKHRLFLPIGPQYRVEEILQLAFHQLSRDHSDQDQTVCDAEELRDYIYKSLRSASYLIVLDDVWDTKIWDMLKDIFPATRKGSRIIITTQILNVHRYVTPGHSVFRIRFLEDDESWTLLRQLVFTSGEGCSRQLEKIGRKIARKCEGLPLAIIEVGEILSKTEKTVKAWTIIAENEDPLDITIDDDTPISKAISLSYRMLPQYLKVCFLYMGVFPKYYEIPRSKLIQLWVSEGILEREEDESFEETAEKRLKQLVSRHVLLNNNVSSTDMETTKTCKLHFTFRTLCVNEATDENFFHLVKKFPDSFPDKMNSKQRLCFHNHVVLGFKQVREWMELSVADACSLLCFGPKQQYPVDLYVEFKLLKVLDALAIRFYEFPDEILALFHLRYLAITCDGDELPTSISRLGSLEILIVHQHHNIKWSDAPVYLPIGIWLLHKLKHLECTGFDLPHPSGNDSLILDNLLTILGVSARSCNPIVLARIPNLTKIGIRIESSHDSAETFSFIGDFANLYDNFKSFACVVVNPNLLKPRVVPSFNFPANIRKISLSGCGFEWEYMRVIAALPNLEALKLRWYAFCGAEWRTSKEDFPKLKFLLLEDLDIRLLICEYDHFPWLERLIVRHCYNLQDIPQGFAFNGSLEMIEVVDCRKFLTKEVEKEIWLFNNTRPELRVDSSWEDKN